MKSDNNALYMILYFIVTLLVAWISFSLIILWFNPIFTDPSTGAVNWWTTLWVSALIIIFSWIFMLIIYFIISLFNKKPCPPKKVECDPCDPCEQPQQNWCPQPCPAPCPPPPCPRPQPCPPPPCTRPQPCPPPPCPQPCSYPCDKSYLHQCSSKHGNGNGNGNGSWGKSQGYY